MDDHSIKSAQNYELLIRLDEQFKGLSRDVRDNTAAMNKNIAVLESTKYSKEDAAKAFAEVAKLTDDHEARIRTTEQAVADMRAQVKTWAKIGATILIVLQIIQTIITFSK